MIGGEIIYKGGSMGKRINGLPAKVKQALQDCIRLWHREFLKDHFGTWAEVNARYPGVYSARTVSYSIQKAKKYGHNDMLVYTGETRAAMLRSISISGTSKQAKGRLAGSNKLNFLTGAGRRNGSPGPDAREEVTAMNDQEKLTMATLIRDRIAKFLQSNEGGDETVRF